MLEYIINKAIDYVGKKNVYLATTIDGSDDLMESISINYGINCYRGSVNDKIERWFKLCQRFNIDHFLCSDGDDPFIDYKLGEILVDSLHNNNADLVVAKNVPCGSLTYAVRAGGLAQILDIHNTEKSEMMWHFFENTSGLKIINHDFLLNEKYNIEDVESIRLTIDYDEDIRFARKLIQEADLMGNEISTEYICKLYSSSSSIFEINSFRQDQFLANQAATIETYLE